jgi:thymidylate kinase
VGNLGDASLIVIDLFAGPGAGKSTNAAGLYSLMKRRYYNVELVREYAKELTYEKDWERLSQQTHVLDEQDRRLRMLVGQVDFAITDGAILNSILYRKDDYHIPDADFRKIVLAYHNKYNNINFYLKRTKKYVPIGRTQTEEQAKDLDDKALTMLQELQVPFVEIVADNSAPEKMLEYIERLIHQDID